MNISNYKIVKQPNGKFALWDDKDKRFRFDNMETAESIKDYLVDQTDLILSKNIISYAQDDEYFKICLSDYRRDNGLDQSEQEDAVSTLIKSMGVYDIEKLTIDSKMPALFEAFLRSITRDDNEFNLFCRKLRQFFG